MLIPDSHSRVLGIARAEASIGNKSIAAFRLSSDRVALMLLKPSHLCLPLAAVDLGVLRYHTELIQSINRGLAALSTSIAFFTRATTSTRSKAFLVIFQTHTSHLISTHTLPSPIYPPPPILPLPISRTTPQPRIPHSLKPLHLLPRPRVPPTYTPPFTSSPKQPP